jgi:hypothetical protein
MELLLGMDETLTGTFILKDGTVLVKGNFDDLEDDFHDYDSKPGRGEIDYLRVVAPMPGQVDDGSMASPPSALLVTAANSKPEQLQAWSLVRGRNRDRFGWPILTLRQVNTIDLSRPALPSGTGLGLARDGTAAVGYGDGSVLSLNVHHHAGGLSPPVRTRTHDDEVWDVNICGDMVLSTGRDRRLTAVTRTGRELFRREVGWVVRVKATADRIWLLGFDSVLTVLERERDDVPGSRT